MSKETPFFNDNCSRTISTFIQITKTKNIYDIMSYQLYPYIPVIQTLKTNNLQQKSAMLSENLGRSLSMTDELERYLLLQYAFCYCLFTLFQHFVFCIFKIAIFNFNICAFQFCISCKEAPLHFLYVILYFYELTQLDLCLLVSSQVVERLIVDLILV